MAIYLSCISFGLVEDVDFFLVTEKHLVGIKGGWERNGLCVRTIIALTRVSPACTIDPADWAAARDEEAATPMASKGSEENIVMASLYGEETVEVSW